MRVSADLRTVNIQLREIQNIPVLILPGGHDPGDHIGQVEVIGNSQQVFPFPNLHFRILPDALYQEGVEPVPSQFAAVLLNNSIAAEDRVYGIHVLQLHFLSRALEIRIEGEAVFREAGGGDCLHDRSPRCGGRWLDGPDHIVEQIIENVPGIHCDFGKLRHNAVDTEGLIPELPGLHNRVRRGARRALGVIEHQIFRGEPAVLSVRRRAFIPGLVCFAQHLHQGMVLIGGQHPITVSRPVP